MYCNLRQLILDSLSHLRCQLPQEGALGAHPKPPSLREGDHAVVEEFRQTNSVSKPIQPLSLAFARQLPFQGRQPSLPHRGRGTA